LQETGEHFVNDTRAFTATLGSRRVAFGGNGAMFMQYVQHGHEKLVGILLLVASQVLGVLPDQREQSMQQQRFGFS